MSDAPQDIPGLDPSISQLPTDILRDLAERGKNDLYFFNTGILGYNRMTESCHGPLCAFVQHNPKRFKRILMPRDHYKSTVITIGGSLWKACRNPNERIHIKNEKADNAERFLRAIRTHAESNRIFRTLYSAIIPPDTRKVRWNDSEVDFKRTATFPEPTFSASGVLSATTSQHFSHIVVDDAISRDAVQSEKVMADTIERMKDLPALLTLPEEDTIWVLGTRWAFHDVYSWWDANFGMITGKFSRSVLEDGVPIFPELLGLDMIDIKRRALGEYLFSCIYMNNPRNPELQDLDVDALLTWTYADAKEETIAVYDRAGEVLCVTPVDKLDITVTVDLAPAEKASSDRNAVVVLGIEPTRGFAIVLHVFAKRCTPLDLIAELIRIYKRWPQIRKIGIEKVAYQAAFKYFLADYAERVGLWLPIVELAAKGKKEIRIKGLQPIIKTSRLALHPTHQLLRNEISEFPLGEHDDVVDALSMQLQLASHWFSQERLEKYLAAEKLVIEKIQGIDSAMDDDEAEEEQTWALMTNRYVASGRPREVGI